MGMSTSELLLEIARDHTISSLVSEFSYYTNHDHLFVKEFLYYYRPKEFKYLNDKFIKLKEI